MKAKTWHVSNGDFKIAARGASFVLTFFPEIQPYFPILEAPLWPLQFLKVLSIVLN